MTSALNTYHRVRLKFSVFGLTGLQALTALAIWATTTGGEVFRLFAITSITCSMLGTLVISMEAALTAMILFEPFRGLLRRAQYLIVPYSESEPIHLVTPIVCFCVFAFLFARNKFEIFRASPLAGATSVLAAICFLQVFNPIQGGLSVGLAGALFFIVPMAWFYFGQSVNSDFVPRILRVIVVLSIISSVYGAYQLTVGYPHFEQVWIDSTDKYGSIWVYNIQRALATFSSSEEWGRYIQIGCIIAAGLMLSRNEGGKRIIWFLASGALVALLTLTGQRTSIFGLILGIAILVLTGSRDFRGVFARAAIIAAPILLVIALANPLSEDAGYESDGNFGTMVTHTSKGLVDPASEGSLDVRLETWSELLTDTLPSNPLGQGLGVTTLAATRNQVNDDSAIDNHFLSLALSAGVPAALLLLWILVRSTVFSFRAWRLSVSGSEQADLWRIMLALNATFLLNNFFGTSFTIYSIAPIGWLIVGWVSSAYARMQDDGQEVSRQSRDCA